MFPALTPSARSWTPGQPVIASFASTTGYEARTLLGATAVGQLLSLSFDNLTEEKGREITDHYAAVRGSFDLFDLPAAVFGGMSSYGHIRPSSSRWRYTAPPNVRYVAPGVVSIGVSLAAVPQ